MSDSSYSILHNLNVDATQADVVAALSSIEGLSKWWTSTTEGNSAPGEVIGFRFGEHVTEVRVDDLKDNRVAWTVTKSNPDWDGTQLTFDLAENDGKTAIQFGHRGWKDNNAFFGHCSMKWATFLLSLKDLVETGKGRPFPNDIPI